MERKEPGRKLDLYRFSTILLLLLATAIVGVEACGGGGPPGSGGGPEPGATFNGQVIFDPIRSLNQANTPYQ